MKEVREVLVPVKRGGHQKGEKEGVSQAPSAKDKRIESVITL
jgi:hypothetical protein